mmetsp:Transcript_36974/g.83097  ORF Transcript_36974/g.83097 Transcript_36974/m.83097 type:complete len:266 (-) Transcript_36974:148-945(-)
MYVESPPSNMSLKRLSSSLASGLPSTGAIGAAAFWPILLRTRLPLVRRISFFAAGDWGEIDSTVVAHGCDIGLPYFGKAIFDPVKEAPLADDAMPPFLLSCGSFSLSLCIVLFIAFVLSTITQLRRLIASLASLSGASGSSMRNRPFVGSRWIALTIFWAMGLLPILSADRNSGLCDSTILRNRTFPGCDEMALPLPNRTSLSVGFTRYMFPYRKPRVRLSPSIAMSTLVPRLQWISSLCPPRSFYQHWRRGTGTAVARRGSFDE